MARRATTRRAKADGTNAQEAKAAPKRTPKPKAPAPAPEGRMKLGRPKAKDDGRANVTKPVPDGMTRYTVTKALGAPDGNTYIKGEVVDLYDEEARYFNKHRAIGLYLGEGDEAEDALPKPVRRKVRDAAKHNAAPTPLADHKTLEVDETL